MRSNKRFLTSLPDEDSNFLMVQKITNSLNPPKPPSISTESLNSHFHNSPHMPITHHSAFPNSGIIISLLYNHLQPGNLAIRPTCKAEHTQ